MITPYQLNDYALRLMPVYEALENEIFKMIAERLSQGDDYKDSKTFLAHLKNLEELRMLNLETIKELAKTTKIAEAEIIKMIKEVGYESVKSIDFQVRDAFDPAPIPNDLDRRLEAFVDQSRQGLNNYVNQTMITSSYGKGTVQEMYEGILNNSAAKVIAGQKTLQQALAETVILASRKGLPTSFRDSANRQWHLQEYSQMLLRTTVNNTYQQIRFDRMRDYDLEFVLVTTLPNPRPACSMCQGHVLSMEFESSDSRYASVYDYGYGTAAGLRGANCRHQLIPFIPDVNINNQVMYSEEEMAHNYEVSQRQRGIERSIRSAKRELMLAETMGDEYQIDRSSRLIERRQQRSREFAEENGIRRRYDREIVY